VNRLIISMTMTVDGVISVGEWYVSEGEHDRAARDQFVEAAAMLLGRKTYEGLAGFWSSQTGGWADRLNPMPKFVASRTLEGPLEWNAKLIEGDAALGVERLKSELDGALLLIGCGELARHLLGNGLIDLRESLQLNYSIRDTLTLSWTLAIAAALLLTRGEPYVAARLCSADEALRRAHGFELELSEGQLLGDTVTALRSALGDGLDEVWAAGADLDLDAAVDLALGALAVVGTALATLPSGIAVTTFVRTTLDANKRMMASRRIPATKSSSTPRGETDVAVQTIASPPGGSSGWHSHPGVVLVAVQSGTVTLYDAHCRTTQYGPGQVVEVGDHALLVRNNTTSNAVLYVTLIVPKGAPLLRIDQPQPATCSAS